VLRPRDEAVAPLTQHQKRQGKHFPIKEKAPAYALDRKAEEAASSRPWLVFAASFVLSLIAAVLIFALLYRSTLKYQINYNEGSNAVLVQRVLDGENLYSPDATLTNNYPPLSFYLVAAVSRLVGPVWVAGRLVAWVSFFGCAGLIVLILRLMTRRMLAAMFGGLVFSAIMASRYDLYVGMFDPQMTAHLFLLTGLALLVATDARSGRAAIAAAVLTVAAIFVKHTVFALPLAVTLWLAAYRRRVLAPWIATGAIAGVAAFAICLTAYGNYFVAGLAAPRAYTFSRAYQKMVDWTVPIGALLAIAFLPARRAQGDATGALCWLYLATSLAVALLGSAAAGTNYNMLFDVIIALSLGIGYGLGRALGDSPAANPTAGWIALATATSVVLSTAQVATAESTHWSAWKATQIARTAETARMVALFAAQPDPVLCEALLLCYWAGKPAEVDPFFGGRSPSTLLARIRNGEFAYVQASDFILNIPGLRAALTQRYREVPGSPGLYQRS
jgi:hypothetical protein